MSAHPEDPTNERPRERTTNPAEENAMTSSQNTSGNEPERGFTDPTADPVSDPTSDPTSGSTAATTEIPSASTQSLPAQAPFRVEPARPVPDDAVRAGSELPHLPPPAAPPSGPTGAPSWSAPEPAPRPALVTVHKGPRPATVMLGLLTVLVAAYLLLANLTRVDLGFSFTGPAVIGAFGGMLLLVGIAGVLAGRLRR
ncbi:hypothetical protein GCM10009740_07260 [Terrabacter terrae]|uniref:DUF1049 domain-containing protein n=1 Tax=Terrabacter terrae TaxID=318434 RepID=A0ABN2TTY6_9MICO